MITREFNLYLHAGHSIPLVINVNQYDQGEQWLFTLFNADGTQYVPSSGAIVGIKSDNLGIINSGTVDSQGRVVINETQQMTAAVGKAVFELLIDSQTHGTANFVVLVEEKPGNNADMSESDLSLLQEAIDATSPLPTGGTVGQVLTKTANGSAWSDAGTPTQAQVAEAVADWADENITVTTGVVIDQSLSVQGAAADAKKTGDEISALKSQIETIEEEIEDVDGISTDLKIALANGFAHVGWDVPNGKDYYDAIVEALDIQIPCESISLSSSAVSSLSEGSATTITATVIPSNTTDAIIWESSDESVATVSAGVITGVYEGSCVITATCGGYSASCSVNVVFSGTTYSVTNTLTNCTTTNSSSSVHENATYTATLVPTTNYEFVDGSVTVLLNGTNVTATAFNYNTKEITIVVTGDITITANATEKLLPTWTSGTPYTISGTNVVEGVTVNYDTGEESSSSTSNSTDYLNCVGAYAIYLYPTTQRCIFFDKNHNYISSSYKNATYNAHTVPTSAAYVRVSGSDSIISAEGTGTLKLIPMEKPTEEATVGAQELTFSTTNSTIGATGSIGGGSGKRYQTNYTPIWGAYSISILNGVSNNYYEVALYDKNKNFIVRTGATNFSNMADAHLRRYAYMRIASIGSSYVSTVTMTIGEASS